MKENHLKRYEKELIYMRDNVPPDDIYALALQLLYGAEYILKILNTKTDIDKLARKNVVFERWAKNIVTLSHAKNKGIEIDLNLTLFEESDFK